MATLAISKCSRVQEGYPSFSDWGHVWEAKYATKSLYLPYCNADTRNGAIPSDYIYMTDCILSTRLCKFSDANNVIKENQTDSRKGYGMCDHIFLVESLIDIYFSKFKKLYCAFVHYEKAFPSI